MAEKSIFSKNLRYLRRKGKKQTQEELGEVLGLSRSVISSYEDGRAEPSIASLCEMSRYFNVSIDSLTNIDLAEVNEEELQHRQNLKTYVNPRKLQVQSLTTNTPQGHYINLVPQKASAGYTRGQGQEVADYPVYRLPFLDKSRAYRAFEIQGNSMLPLQSGSIVVGEYLEALSEIKDGQIYIVITQNDGIVLKEVYNKVSERGTLLLRSSNVAYEPFEVPVEEVKELWRFVAHIGRDFPQEYDPSEDLREAFSRMEREFEYFKN